METLQTQWQEAKVDLALIVPFNLDKHTVAVFRVGSHSHGTYIAPETPSGVDDVDLMVIVMPPPEFKLGLKKFEHASFQHGRYDVVVYDYEKWMTLLLKQNPNVIGTLFLEKEDYFIPQEYSHIIRKVLNNTDLIISKQMATAFLGYAQSQMYKMTHQAHQGYMGNKRKMLVEKFGYDVKNAAHMIRLLRMCGETMATGKVVVRRPDAQEIMDIKQGKWSMAEVMAESDRLIAKAREAEANSQLPNKPDTRFIDKTIVEGYFWCWNRPPLFAVGGDASGF